MTKNLNPQYEHRLITRGFLRYIGPALVSLLFAQIAPVVDAFCISGKLGDEALSAISVVSPVYYFFNVIAVLAGIGAGVTIAKASGTGEREETGRVFTRVLMLTIAVSVIVSGVLLLFMDPVLRFLSATPENMDYSRDYLRFLLIGMVFYVLNMAGAYVLTDDNNPNLAMAGGIVASIVNIIVDFVGMYALHLGIWVTAFGTQFGMFCSCLVYMLHFRRKERLCRIDFSRGRDGEFRIMEILKPGIPQALMNLLLVLQILVTNLILSRFVGTGGLSNAAIIENLELIATILAAGISESVMPFTASYFGEGNRSSMYLVKRTAVWIGGAVMLPLVAGLMIWPEWFMGLFSVESDVMLRTLPGSLRIVAFSYLFLMFSNIFQNYLTSIEEENTVNISFIIQFAVQISLTILLARWMPAFAPWLAALAGSVSQFFYLAVIKKMLKGTIRFCPENTLLLTGAYASAGAADTWLEQAASVLDGAELETVKKEMLDPFIRSLPAGKTPLTSFTVLDEEDGIRRVILRYNSKKDYMESGVEGDALCARSDFNSMRRWMMDFNKA